MKSLSYFVVVLLIVGSVAAIGIGKEASVNTKTSDEIIVVHHGTDQVQNLAVEGRDVSYKLGRAVMPLANIPVANTEEDEIHPTISAGDGKYFVSYAHSVSILEKDIYMTVSEDGETWTPAGFWDLGEIADYPASDYWGDNRFCGAFSTSTEGIQYLMDLEDIDDTGTWGLISWDWSDDGWSDLGEFDIACHNSQNTWEYGVMSSVGTTDYGDWDVVDGPHMFFRSPEDEGTGYISWDLLPGCAHSAASIDKTLDFTYNAYDWYNDGTGYWDLLVWKRDFSDMLEGDSEIITVESTINVEYPTLCADDDNVIVVGQSDDAGNKDLVCFYSQDGGDTWDQSTVVNTNDDEIAPDITLISAGQAACVFVKNNDLYVVQTENGGETWASPAKINDETGTVIEEYRTADTCSGAAIWADEREDNPDIYFSTLSDGPSKPSTPDGPIEGKVGKSQTYSTSSVDPNGDDISYGWDWDGDGVVDEWTGFKSSGTPVSTSHTWTSGFTGEIKVKGKDTNDEVGPWSDPLAVSMPRSKQATYPLLQKFLEIFPNALPLLRNILGL